MKKEQVAKDAKRSLLRKPEEHETKKQPSSQLPQLPIVALQNRIGNGAVQRLLAQRKGTGAFTLDDETANRINQARGSGQPLDGAVQEKMSGAIGTDFSSVRVHTSGEADQLNQQLGAKAFTTGQDIFFRGGAYNPQSSGGQELIAHELTHVVQQSSGVVGGGSAMTVNAPGDQFEQEAEAVAKSVANAEVAPKVQRQELEDEDELQMKAIQRAALTEDDLPEEEEQVQMQELPEEEEELVA